ncbi:Putative rRNA methylase [Tindallia magadiensis]|uniref:Putative rRNA methylase n=1 Tax=Tindallia magadiensis TaxID=69895 RepID=A0A1I3AGB0_9FIRM|nr:class I SAM-dependent methyltransferase [Tindallia magadiensis]SFH49082.1 Putative rRNA methylase [Tindallia magadiensis]
MNQKHNDIIKRPLRITGLNHIILRQFLKPGYSAIDATAGNGLDTLFLLRSINPGGYLTAFDIQVCALKNTENRIKTFFGNAQPNFQLIHDTHGNIAQYIKEPVHVAVFNLGYLPGENHQITTSWNELKKALDMLTGGLIVSGGIVSITVYSGHESGKHEQSNIFRYIKALSPQKFNIHVTRKWNTVKPSPVLILIECL